MYCQKCGIENPEEARFCKSCGGQVGGSIMPVARLGWNMGQLIIMAIFCGFHLMHYAVIEDSFIFWGYPRFVLFISPIVGLLFVMFVATRKKWLFVTVIGLMLILNISLYLLY